MKRILIASIFCSVLLLTGCGDNQQTVESLQNGVETHQTWEELHAWIVENDIQWGLRTETGDRPPQEVLDLMLQEGWVGDFTGASVEVSDYTGNLFVATHWAGLTFASVNPSPPNIDSSELLENMQNAIDEIVEEFETGLTCNINLATFANLHEDMTLEEMIEVIGEEPHGYEDNELGRIHYWRAADGIGRITAWITEDHGTAISTMGL